MKIIRTQSGHETILAHYFTVNDTHLQKWSPAIPSGHHSIESWKRRLDEREIEFENGLSAHFIGTDEEESLVIGSCSISNIVRGVFQACHMGYSIAECYQGQGYMKQIVSHAISFAFDELKLHRIMANHMPDNKRSANLLKSLGFVREGYAKEYLLINGRWEDHVLNALVNNRVE
ncbi:MAG: GNAT family N-acetyltransferase [Gammaproteobacteria bacterium]|jgi:ribosomal-protein-alanine N-acetyltransferase|nr:GNAT family N-acetyltransferase [Gammaproteobacteria bacterium]MDP6731699.1 GNAT family N-acetyltransferase [Gammaproteobacteria bacterium]|tara:strand:- start:692 stop:1216 length:525 start_codon:yes stop_codon:yes gene_type:complete